MGRHGIRNVPVDAGGIEFNLAQADWLRLFRDVGFEVVDYLELQAPASAPLKFSIPGGWAHRWPSEQVWKLRKRGSP